MTQMEYPEAADSSELQDDVVSVESSASSPAPDQDSALAAALADALEAERSSKQRCRQLESELSVLRGGEPLPGFESVDEPENGAGEPSRGYVGTTYASRGSSSGPENDLVREALRRLLPEVLPDLLREALPRHYGISVLIENEGVARIPVEEVVARTYSSVVQVVSQLAARASRVPEEDGMWSLGVGEEESSLLAQIARCAPHRPKAVNRSRSL